MQGIHAHRKLPKHFVLLSVFLLLLLLLLSLELLYASVLLVWVTHVPNGVVAKLTVNSES